MRKLLKIFIVNMMSGRKTINRILLFIFIITIVFPSTAFAQASGKIKIYFNHPVNTSLSTGISAIYLNHTMDDTLIAYINRANYSLDIAVYNYVQTSAISNISTAINNAYSRGVHIRWIYDGSSSNTGLSQVNAAINRLASPTGVNYGIMHNKFMIVDAHSTNPSDPLVWTGSCNWDAEQFNSDVNNSIIIQDQNLALAYTTEFNEMWGDTGLVPNTTLSKFGPFKTNNTPHIFTIGGSTVESYFSPSDSTNTHILSCINSANSQLFFGVYAFTFQADANAINSRIQNGVYAAGIIDQFSQSYTPYTLLNPVMGSLLQVYNTSGSIYHNKLMIADPCDSTSDPLVETGSHNWSLSANTKNDENTLIIHDATAANIYYQSFWQNFADLGGTMTSCIVSATQEIQNENYITIYPNPVDGKMTINDLEGTMNEVALFDVAGKQVAFVKTDKRNLTINTCKFANGIYLLEINRSNFPVEHHKILIHHE